MSLKYIDSNGASHVVSGMTPGGNLETGAVATREGTATNPTVISKNGGESTAVVTFADAMPDADYEISCTSWEGSSAVVIHVDTTTVSENGFSLKFRNTSVSGDIPANTLTIHWKAFKLYEVADAEALYSAVQDIEKAFPADASSSNKLATIRDVTSETRSLDRRIDDLEDYMPSNVSIDNKVATQADLANVSIDELGDIEDVDLDDVADGQTLVWDSTNSKWVNGAGGKTYTAGDGINISGTDEISTNTDNTSVVIGNNKELKVADTYKTIFVGTRAQWDALSTADKVKYNEAHITDDVIGGEVADVVQNGLMSPVTSNAVYDKFTALNNAVAMGELSLDYTSGDKTLTLNYNVSDYRYIELKLVAGTGATTLVVDQMFLGSAEVVVGHRFRLGYYSASNAWQRFDVRYSSETALTVSRNSGTDTQFRLLVTGRERKS